MPYDTRRKSLSLPSLGIQLPNASRAHRPSISKSSPTQEHSSPPQAPPSKKIKRSHPSEAAPSAHPPTLRTSTSSTTKNVSFAERPKSSRRAAYNDTPPASPEPTSYSKYDTEGINDDIVVSVIEQLEKTGNRPHMIKELATVLSSTNDAVAGSANPGALLSSRLASYIKRPGWTALSPCPIEKELTTVHPRKVYYYLTTMTRQDLPNDSSDLFAAPNAVGKGGKRIISPSISSASVDEDTDAAEERKREALSPSPEVDLSSHDMDTDQDMTFAPTYAGRSNLRGEGSHHTPNGISQRAASPPLEGDEREFTQTASSVRMRGMSLDDQSVRPHIEVVAAPLTEDSDEDGAKLNRETAEALFGSHHPHMLSSSPRSSPLVKPLQLPQPVKSDRTSSHAGDDVEMQESFSSVLGGGGAGLTWDTQETEDIQIEDLDDLFGAC